MSSNCCRSEDDADRAALAEAFPEPLRRIVAQERQRQQEQPTIRFKYTEDGELIRVE